MSSLPSWARVTAFIGTPSLIAIYLAYMLATGVSATSTTAAEAATAARSAMAAHVERMEQMNEDSERQGDAMIRVLRQVCLNTAPTKELGAKCLE